MQTIKKELVNLTDKLIRFKTISNNKRETKNCFQFIEDYFKNSNLYLKTFNFKDTLSLVIANTNTKNLDLLFNGHIDVISAKNKWFKTIITKNNIIGRGAIDMKASLAVLMLIFKNLPKTNKRVGLMIVSDEEIGGKNGTKYLLEKEKYRSKMTIIAEESSFDIVTKQKGQITLRLDAQGKSGHGSQPWSGINAIEELIQAYWKLRKRFPKKQKSSWSTSSINLGLINGGAAPNVIPAKASLWLDIRYPTKQMLLTIMKRLDILTKDANLSSCVESISSPMESRKTMSFINKIRPIIEQEIGRQIKLKWTNYCSDGRYFSDKNMPVIEFGPVGKNYHADNEYVEIRSLIQYYNILQKTIFT